SSLSLRRVEVSLLGVEVEVAPALALLGGQPLGRLDPLAEANARAAQLELRVDPEPTADVDSGEEDVAELLGATAVGVAPEFGSQLGKLVVEVLQGSLHAGVLEPDRCRAPLDLPRVEQRGQRLGDVVERALAPLVFALDPLPARPDGACRVDLLASEDVWVS